MSPRLIGIAMLAVGSEVLGIFTGAWFYRLFLKSVPPLSMSALNQSAAHGIFLFYGGVLGAVIALWSLIAIALSRLFRSRALGM